MNFKIDNGYKFAIVRAYRNNGVVDANSAQTIKNARAAGLNMLMLIYFHVFHVVMLLNK